MEVLFRILLGAFFLFVAFGGDTDPDWYDDEHDVSGLIDED